jgi:hypothetical protein
MLKPEQGTESKQHFGSESGAKAGENSRPSTKRFLIVLGQDKKWWLFDHGQPQNIANYYTTVQNSWLTDNGNPQEVANCVWACGKPEI